MDANRISLNDRGIIEIAVVGDQTLESIQSIGDQAVRLAQQQKAQGKPAIMLYDLNAIGKVSPEARKLVVELVKSNDYDKLAMFGADTILRFGVNLILQATNRGDQVKYFNNRTSGEAWLLA